MRCARRPLCLALGGLALWSGLQGVGCHRDRPVPSSEASETATATATPASASLSTTDGGLETSARATTDAVFSAPVAAARARGVDLVAGLVAAEGVIRAVAFQGSRTLFKADVLRGVKWAPDAELHAEPAGDGFALVWSGLRDGKPGRALVEIGPQGEPRAGTPADIGAAYCGSKEGLAWIGPRTAGSTDVEWRRWGDPSPRSVAAVPKEREPAVVCGEHAVVVLAEGPDDLTAFWLPFRDGGSRAPSVILRNAEFQDEQREHEAFLAGEELGVVRVGVSGGVATRTVTRDGPRGPWHRLQGQISDDDEVVFVDGDRSSALIVMTHEIEGACPGSGATPQSVRAIRIDRTSGTDTLLDLAAPDCAHGAPGPFWLDPLPAGPVVAWVEHRGSGRSKSPPNEGVAYRTIGADGVRAGHIAQSADAIADGGCDEGGCSVAALVRPPGGDGMQPGPIRVFSYP